MIIKPLMTSSKKTWRDQWAPRIAAIIAERAGQLGINEAQRPIPEAFLRDIRRELRAKYPGDDRPNGHPYRIWLSEARVQLGLISPVNRPGRPPNTPVKLRFPDPHQQELFRDVSPELKLIQSVIDLAAAGRTATEIHKAAPHLIAYPIAVRIIELAVTHAKTPEQILRYLEADEARRRVIELERAQATDRERAS